MNELLVLIFILLILVISYYVLNRRVDVTYIKSNLDDQEYLVRDSPGNQTSADMLAKIKQNLLSIVDHLNKNRDRYKEFDKNIDMLNNKITNTIISENDGSSSYTSYSVNKGDEIVFCLRSKITKEYHDMNLMMYVAIHELAHIGNPEYGHGTSFKNVFGFLTTVAMEMGLYNKVDFKSNPVEYCGMMITESIV